MASVRSAGSAPGSVGTSKTFDVMVQEKFIWNGDDASQDTPFIMQVGGKPLVILPRVNFPTNDLIVWIKAGDPLSAYFEGFRKTFDFLYDEGRRGVPPGVDLSLHSDMGGRPTLIGAFERALRYARGFEGVWFARRRDIAEWNSPAKHVKPRLRRYAFGHSPARPLYLGIELGNPGAGLG